MTVKGNFNGSEKLVSVTQGRVYTEYTAFIRKGENNFPASANERRALEIDKKFDLIVMNENLRFELISNLKALLSRSESGLYNPLYFYRAFRNKHTISLEQDLFLNRDDVARIIIAIVQVRPPRFGLSTRFIEQAISSGRYLSYNPREGRYERSEFLQRLYELDINIRRFTEVSGYSEVTEFVPKYNAKRKIEQTIRIAWIDVLYMAALFDRFEDVVQLSVALLAYLLGDKTKLSNVKLNESSPIATESEKVEAETPTDIEVIEWVLTPSSN